MKTKVLILMIIIVALAEAQDRIDPQSIINKNSFPNVIKYKQEHFLTGWNYSRSGRKIDSALNVNSSLHFDWDSDNYPDSIQYILPIRYVVGTEVRLGILDRNSHLKLLNAMSQSIYPTISVDSTNNFKPRPYDSSGAVFGFKYKDKIMLLDSSLHSDPNYNKALLYKNSVNDVPTIVLKDIWKDSVLHFLNYDDNMKNTLDINGKTLYLTINLKSLEIIPSEIMDSVILSIRIPYTLEHTHFDTSYNRIHDNTTYSYIRFNQFPVYTGNYSNDIKSIIGTMHDNRGLARNMSDTNADVRVWEIPAKMLCIDTNRIGNCNLTLSTEFLCNNLPFNNPYLTPIVQEDTTVLNYITHLDLEVTYHGKLDLGLTYFRFDTPRAKNMYEGMYDSTIHYWVDSTISYLNKKTSHPKLFRFYGGDEIIALEWGANRYVNMLVDTILNTAIPIEPNINIPISEHALCFQREYTNESNVNFLTANPVPFYKNIKIVRTWPGLWDYCYERIKRYNLYFMGYSGNIIDSSNYHLFSLDSLNSQYETFLMGSYYTTLPITDNNIYEYSLDSDSRIFKTNPIQAKIEKQLYVNYFKNQPMLYSSVPWHSYLWPFSETWRFNSTFPSVYEEWILRPKTGEEARLIMNYPILLGAKGIYNWIKTTEPHVSTTETYYELGCQASKDQAFQDSLPTGDKLIYSDTIGGDFIKTSNDPNFGNQFIPSCFALDTMGITADRFYYGIRSVRVEIAKTNRWIKAVDKELMKLRLQAWLGKGFIKLYSQDPQYQANNRILGKFIDTNNIRTRKIFQPYINGGGNNNPPVESPDSSFYDVTLMKNTDYIGMDSVFYIGLLNRRTDPLIYDQTVGYDPDNTIRGMKFLSSAEFDDKCNISPDTSKWSLFPDFWKGYWWKRMGCRELRIPFKFTNSNDPNLSMYTMLHITELGATDTNLAKSTYRKPDYYHLIDTMIAKDSVLVVRLQPGQSKLLRCEVTHTKQPIGFLAYSNQRKLVAFPAEMPISSDPGNGGSSFGSTDLVRYHLTYHRNDTVFYMRSRPVNSKVPFYSIDWEPYEYCLNDSLVLLSRDRGEEEGHDIDGETILCHDFLYKCKYPSIVVRYDSLECQCVKAYIVYECYQDYKPGIDNEGIIVENIFACNVNVNNLNADIEHVHKGHVIGNYYHGIHLQEYGFGLPMINASYSGNYYTWADSIQGIAVGWKKPNNIHFAHDYHKKYLHWNNPSHEAMHPSLPSYSRINHQINETSVVWQEKIGGYNRIFYSRLNMINDTLRNYLAPVIIDTMNSQGFMDIDTLNMIARIGGLGSYFPTHDLIPTIYRGVETKVNTYDPVIQQFKYRFFDRIYWSGYNFNGYGITQYRIDLTNNLFYPTTPLFLGSDYPMFIWSPNYILSQPSVSQGSFYYNNNYSSLYYNNSDSAVVINFVAFPEGSNPTTTNSRIWQVNLPYSNIYDYWSQDYYDLDSKVYSRLTSYKGTYPQLSAKQYIQNNHNNLYQNRRIFETGNSIYHLVSTQEYFHRDFDNEDYSYNFFGYHHDNKKLMVTPIWFSKSDGKLFTIGLKSSYYDSTCECNRHLDTITSNWISLKDITDAGFLEYGKGIGNFLIKLERMSDGRRFNIKLSEKSDSIFIHHKLKLLNANENEKYRIIWSKGHQNATYAEEMVLGGLPVVEDMNDSLNNPMTERSIIQENYEIIDLGGESINLDSDKMLISIYPNPAGNNVFVKAQLPSSVYLEFGNSISNHKIKYQVYSQIGCIQMTVEGTPGETVSINTSSLPAGVYFIRAEHKSDNYYEPVSPVVEPFVISR